MKNKNKLYWLFSLLILPSLVFGQTPKKSEDFHFKTIEKAKQVTFAKAGSAYVVHKKDFPALEGVTCYVVEVFDEAMRLPHWHPNASELGYVVFGSIEIILWRSPGETSVFKAEAGTSWFIPQGALHSLNNLSKEKAVLLVGFSSDDPKNVDLPTAFNGIPLPIRDSYTSPHEDLKTWQGPLDSPLFGKAPVDNAIKNLPVNGSPYKFDFAKATPLFSDTKLGSIVWGVKNNWPILEHLSLLRASLKPNAARDAIWYPDVGTLYVVTKGTAEFFIQSTGQKTKALQVKKLDYLFVPTGFLHTFINNSTEDFETVAFFNKANPTPEVSLSVATSFFPNDLRKAALTEYGDAKKSGDPLKHLNYKTVSPYIIPVGNAK